VGGEEIRREGKYSTRPVLYSQLTKKIKKLEKTTVYDLILILPS
jgi:hypothetical protein